MAEGKGKKYKTTDYIKARTGFFIAFTLDIVESRKSWTECRADMSLVVTTGSTQTYIASESHMEEIKKEGGKERNV